MSESAHSAVRGPLEGALDAVLAQAKLFETALAAEACEQDFVGEFRIDLSTLMPDTKKAAKAFCQDAAARLAALAEIDEATGVPPRVFLRPSLEFLCARVSEAVLGDGQFGASDGGAGRTVALVFSSPNANKPLHLGHLRNNMLGMALSGLHEALGFRVVRYVVLSDWGIHICQAALAWSKWGGGSTPESSGRKSDAFVGDYYVRFHKEAGTQPDVESADGEMTPLQQEARALLRAADAGDGAAWTLKQRIVEWAWRGIEETHARIGSRFDVTLRERDMLPTSMGLIERGLKSGTCVRRADGSVYVDLPEIDTGEVTLVRSDGTPVVYTQLMGVHVYRYEHSKPDRVLLLLGHEWELGMDTIKKVLLRLGFAGAAALEPLHYGMVTLEDGKMKSREGRIVETDGLLDRVRDHLQEQQPELDRAKCETLALGLLKYHFLRIRRTLEAKYDERAIWEQSLPSWLGILAAIENAERAAAAPDPEDALQLNKSARAALRKLLAGMNALPAAVERAAVRREPSLVLRLLDDLVQHAARAELETRHFPHRREVCRAFAIVLRRGLAILNVPVP
jgi:arginyl-tRNA synthetase